MFGQTGVTRPELDTAELDRRKGHYETLSRSAGSAQTATNGAVQQVLAMNKGAAADEFRNYALGGSSITVHLTDLRDAASRTATAYGDASSKGGAAKTAMIALDKQRESEFWAAVFTNDGKKAAEIVSSTRQEFWRLETQGGRDVTDAFSRLALPTPKPLGYEDGDVDPRVEADWRASPANGGMTDAEKQAFLQQMADDYARRNGFPPIKIDFTRPKSGALGEYSHGNNSLQVDPANLSDPHVMNTVIHEMQHRRQYTGYKDRWFWDDYKNGMSKEDAERWKRLNADEVRNKGEDPNTSYGESYWPRPVEVDAREAGRRATNELSYKEYWEMRHPGQTYQAPAGKATMDFYPPVWKEQGDVVDASAQELYRNAEPVVTMMALPARSNSPIDTAAVAGDALCLMPWHNLIAGAKEGMTTLSSKMIGTGTDYAATEEDNTAAADRFWK